MSRKLRTLWQACGGEIAQLNIPAVFFHPPLDGRDFFIPPHGRHVVKESLQLFSFPLFLPPSFLALPAFFLFSTFLFLFPFFFFSLFLSPLFFRVFYILFSVRI